MWNAPPVPASVLALLGLTVRCVGVVKSSWACPWSSPVFLELDLLLFLVALGPCWSGLRTCTHTQTHE